MRFPALDNFVDGGAATSKTERVTVRSPLDDSELTTIPRSTSEDVASAVNAASKAFSGWSSRTPRQRAEVFFRYRELLLAHKEELADLIHLENGKTLDEARAEIVRAVEVTEFACALPQMFAGEVLEVSPGVECRVDHAPLGVVASITPFNFPCMVPHWTIPIAIALGNSFVLKPSESAPLTAQRTAELLLHAGLPPGVFNVIHGDKLAVEAICESAAIKAISFVGSTVVAKQVYRRATNQLKRALCLGGAKNHLIVLPDAHLEQTAANVVASMAGCAGQRCMAAASMVAVGEVDRIVQRICEIARGLVPGDGLGPVISAAAHKRIVRYIDEAENAGAQVLVDGRHCHGTGHPAGYYLGATVLDHVTSDMAIAQDEVFGPVLAILRAKNIDDAIAIENRSPYGNAAAVYTQNGAIAKLIGQRASAGMIGVNIGVPVPLEPFGFGGWNDSKFGVGDITGKSSVYFWTQSKKTTSRWNTEIRQGWMGH